MKTEQGEQSSPATDRQPSPTPSLAPPVWDMVIADMHSRDRFGGAKYGTVLRPFNGRDCIKDAYQEALDLAVYLRQLLYERDGR